MKISELIYALESMQREHGDLDVERMNITGDRVPIRPPELAHRAKLRGREKKPRFAEWHTYEDVAESALSGAPGWRVGCLSREVPRGATGAGAGLI